MSELSVSLDTEGPRAGLAARIDELWRRHGPRLLLLAIALMALLAAIRMMKALPLLLGQPGAGAGVDILFRHREVHRWFAGLSVYDMRLGGDYPPASYLILWPLLGWMDLGVARWIWAATNLFALGFLAFVAVRQGLPSTRREVVFLALVPLAVEATCQTLLLGQLGILVLASLLAGVLLLARSDSWRGDVAAGAFLVASLVKPTMTAPFFWIVLFTPRRIRPMALVVAGYVLLTLVAGLYQEPALPALLRQWLTAGGDAETHKGYANVAAWLTVFGLKDWAIPAAVMILAVSGVWFYARRRADLWLLLGVAALVARFYVHHRSHDNLLLLIPLIALFRLTRTGTSPVQRVTAVVLFFLTLATALAPDFLWRYVSFAPLVRLVYIVIWLTDLGFLAVQAGRSHRSRLVGARAGPPSAGREARASASVT